MSTGPEVGGIWHSELLIGPKGAWEEMRLGRKSGARARKALLKILFLVPGSVVGEGERQAPICFQKMTLTRLWRCPGGK